jgi:hypothetical protein
MQDTSPLYQSIRIVSMEGGTFEATRMSEREPWIVKHATGGFVFWGEIDELRDTIFKVIDLMQESLTEDS